MRTIMINISKIVNIISSKGSGTESTRNLEVDFSSKRYHAVCRAYIGRDELQFQPLCSHGIQVVSWGRTSVGTRVLSANPILLPSRFPRQPPQAFFQREGSSRSCRLPPTCNDRSVHMSISCCL